MKKILILCFMLALAVSVHAADIASTDGLPNDSGIYPIQVDSDRVVTFAADAGIKYSYEAVTSSDTLTVGESGKTLIVDPVNSGVTFTLPDADVGMKFTFTASDGNQNFVVNPQDTDFFRGVVNSAAGSTFSAGDSVISPGNSGDSITVFCGEDLYWDVVQKTGTWVDND